MPDSFIPAPDGFYSSTEQWFSANQAYPNAYIPYYGEIAQRTLPQSGGAPLHDHFFSAFPIQSPPSFVAVIANGRVWGKQGSIISNDNKLIVDLSIEYGRSGEEHSIFHQWKGLPYSRTSETLAVLTCTGSENYYHWMFDVFVRFHLLQLSQIPIDRYVLNPEAVGRFQSETLRALGVPESKMIFTHPGFHLQADRLVVPSMAGWTGFPAKWACHFLRSTFLSHPTRPRRPGMRKRMYISRSRAARRRIVNENEVWPILQRRGFVKVQLEGMPVAEQASLFASADAVVAPHGAGLTNLVFCDPGTKVLELFTPSYVNVCYWTVSNLAALEYSCLIGDGVGEGDTASYLQSMRIAPSGLREMLEQMGI